MKIGFCGATHLGLCYSGVAAQKGFKITCFDFDAKKIKELKNFQLNIKEPKLKNILIKFKRKLYFLRRLKRFV